jgi:hypothetical protein
MIAFSAKPRQRSRRPSRRNRPLWRFAAGSGFLATVPGRIAPSRGGTAIIGRVGHHPDGLRKGKGPGRLPGNPSPFQKSNVGPRSGETIGNLNLSLYSAGKGKVRDVILQQV